MTDDLYYRKLESTSTTDLVDMIRDKDKRIEELEKENAELKSELTKKADTNHSLVEQMAKLEEENNKLLDVISNYEVKVADLEKQIEKMKNWCNCKNYQQCLIELAEQGKGMKPSECCVNCKKWEIEE